MKYHGRLLIACAMWMCALAGRAEADLIAATYPIPADPVSGFSCGAGMGTDGGEVFDNRKAQSFTTLEGGTLSTVSFVASRLPGTDVDLRLNVMTFDAGQPDEMLATTLIGIESFYEGFLPGWPEDFTHEVDFSDAGVVLEQDRMYALVFLTDTTEANYRLYGDYGGYDGGQLLSSQNGSPYKPHDSDLFFEVRVLIPAPGSIVLLVIGVIRPGRRRSP